MNFPEKWFEPIVSWRLWGPPIAMALFLIFIAQFSEMTSHILAELIPVILLFALFVLVWSTRLMSGNNFLLFLACGYFWIGSLGFIHILTYIELNIFTGFSIELPTQNWIGIRFLEAMLLLIAPFAAQKMFNSYQLFTVFGIIFIGLTASITFGYFPVTSIESAGLTTFKTNSGYLIILTFALAIFVLLRHGHAISIEEKIIIAMAITMTMCAELSFIFLIDIPGPENLAAHTFKLCSYWLIFQAVVITNLKKPYIALAESEERYKNIIDGTNELIAVIDKDGHLKFVNRMARTFFGLPEKDCIGLPISDFIHPDDRDWTMKSFQHWIEQKATSILIENRIVSRDGSNRHLSWDVTAHYDDGGNLITLNSIARDISARKLAQEKLKEREERYRRVIATAHEGFWLVDMQEQILDVNEAYIRRSGYTRDELLAMNISDLEVRERNPDTEAHLQNIIRLGSDQLTTKHRTKGGEIWPVETSITYEDIEGGQFFCFLRDVTEKNQAEIANRELSARFQAVVDGSPAAIALTDRNGTYILVNRTYRKWMSASSSDLVGKTIHDFFPKGEAEEILVNDRKVIETGKEIIMDVIRTYKDGQTRTVITHKCPLFSDDGEVIAVSSIILDVTKRAQAEESLRGSEERFRLAFENVAVGNVVINEKGVIEIFNSTAEKIFGYSADEVVGQNVNRLMPEPERSRHDGDIYKYIKSGNTRIIGKGREVIGRRKNGEEFPMHLGIGEMIYGDNRSFIGSITELTEFKDMESRLRRSQKLEAVGQLSGGIAHDFNNILGVIVGNLEILQRMFADDDKASGRIETAIKGAKRGADLTRKLLGFSRKSGEGMTRTSVNDQIRNMEDLLGKSLTVAINVEKHLAENLWAVEVDPGDLQDAILNLALNARDAMLESGVLIIKTSNETLNGDFVRQNPGSMAGDFVMLSISDNGSGMVPEVKERVLEPFFSTKAASTSTGLGLSMVYGFVQRSDGHMEIYSKPEKGTTVQIYLPRVNEDAKNTTKEIVQSVLPRGNETILVVDDEEHLIDIASTHLEDLGYQAITANGGKQALEFLQSNVDIDLLFSDVIMPGNMDGYELAEQALKLRPEIKLLLTSGYAKRRERSNVTDKKLSGNLENNLLRKPYNRSVLANTIRNALDGISPPVEKRPVRSS